MKKIVSYCKVNLGLNIFPLKQGDEKHEIESIFMLCKDYYNEIYIEENNLLNIQSDTMNSYEINALTNSLLYFSKKFDCHISYKIIINKKIPSQAGLGGSSSTIGYLFRYLIDKNKIQITNKDLKDIAIDIGSDVPFFMFDNNICFVKGYGEIIVPIKGKPLPSIEIIPNNYQVNCKKAFELFDNMNDIKHNDYNEIINNLENIKSMNLINNLEDAALIIEPELSKFKKANTIMTGSGSYFISIK